MDNQKWLKNLQTAFEFGIPHISSYALTVEEKTALHSFIQKGIVKPMDEELALEHFNILVTETQKQGFVHYEISNFGKPNYFSKHNTSYWLGTDYMGVGPSAHSFNNVQRSWNISNNAKYIQAIQQHKLPNEVEILTINDRFNEYIMTGLRTIWGISYEKIETEFSALQLEALKKRAQQFIDAGLLELHQNVSSKENLVTTKKGKFLADGIASDLFIV